MASKAVAIATLVLRIFTLISLATCIVVLATNTITDTDGNRTTFKVLIAYRYVIATAGIGLAYTVIQIPFVIYHVCTGKRMIPNSCLPEFDFYGDKVIGFLLATGVGVGFGVTFELKRLFKGLDSDLDKFLQRGNIATALLFVGFITMLILSILSSITRNTRNGSFG
ncbi:hypothetical protein F0562_025375 [Nyssa sinensis]|uniref:CASP-like protein n=1 Tax=Nyssa sinensis TaxID=561372 RepID=A0A5J5BI31_9ASTE|nr:hypothetical protein F0562_025375 [Nyssa sinensis]